MPLTDEDLAVIKTCYEEKNWHGAEICRQFIGKGWSPRTVNDAIIRLQNTGSIYRKKGSGRPDTATNLNNAEVVEDLISQAHIVLSVKLRHKLMLACPL